MKKILIGALAAATMLAGNAYAVTTATILTSSTNEAGNTADAFAPGYRAFVPGGASFDFDPTVTPPPGSIQTIYKSPFEATGISESQSYYSVGGTSGPNGAPSPVTLTLGSAITSFRMLWGSIDSYNQITFSNGASFTGVDLLGAGAFNINGNSNGGAGIVALVDFDFGGDSITSITFESERALLNGGGVPGEDVAAFEFALVPVPAAGLLLLTGLGGLALVGRRRRAIAA